MDETLSATPGPPVESARCGVLEHEEHALPFVDYLRLCFRWGGFPRLERADLDAKGRLTLEHLRRGIEPF
jgi:hypothetical protein